ncbi:MAG: metallophosphoesterase [Bacteroidota bacterium]
MKTVFFSCCTLLIMGFIFSDEKCKKKPPVVTENAKQFDGPYVLYKGDAIFVRYIMEQDGWKVVKNDTSRVADKSSLTISVATDDTAKTFIVKLKEELKNEKTEYKKVSKQLAISDIEGSFRVFRKLLQANGVIDSNYNWTFGEGHLVLTGDFFDRGMQVTETLWLIYSLEEKAKAAGGYVHFILGNHEIMNMSGDIRYVHPKYKDIAVLLGERYEDLYGENSELGRWLRTKNIAERVGDVLYIHGGISTEMNNMNITLQELNELTRPWYHDSTFRYDDGRLDVIYGDAGPFWYRGYYKNPSKTVKQQVDSTLTKFNVKHIATGHTLVGDTVSSWYNGKLFNTDVHHATGRSEGLLYEDKKFYRVNTVGEKFLIKE